MDLMDLDVNQILSRAEAAKRETAKRLDRAERFRALPNIIEAEKRARESIPGIREAMAECDPLFRRVERLGPHGCQSLLNEYGVLRGQLHQIEDGLSWLESLTDADFSQSTRDGMYLSVQFEYFAAELGNRTYKGDLPGAFKRVHEQLHQWVKDNRRGLGAKAYESLKAEEGGPHKVLNNLEYD
jgi:hypothetical protein